MDQRISLVIPNYNGARTIGNCLAAVFACGGDGCEVIVVDDCSGDASIDIIKQFPCKLVQLEKHGGASAARNAGARACSGEVLFFIDADCLLREDTLARVRENIASRPADVVIGGTYCAEPADHGFFSAFQSVFINYSETKKSAAPDYIATHAMVIHRAAFHAAGGFRENFLPILEDVEFSHRLRRLGYRLMIDPLLQVRHIFGFSLGKSLRNAARKSRYWIAYSLANRDVLSDSGTASNEIKINGVVWLMTALVLLLSSVAGARWPLMPLPLIWAADLLINRRQLKAFFAARGVLFGIGAALYYLLVYPAAVWWGTVRGVTDFMRRMKKEPA